MWRVSRRPPPEGDRTEQDVAAGGTPDALEDHVGRQPWLHDLLPLLSAPTQLWSGPGGQVRELGLQGCFHGDRRVLSLCVLTVDGEEPVPVSDHADGGDAHVFVALPRGVGDPGADPTVRVERRRELSPGVVRERVSIRSSAASLVRLRLEVTVAADHARLDDVKAGKPAATMVPAAAGDGHLLWTAAGLRCSLSAHGARTSVTHAPRPAALDLEVQPGETVDREWVLAVDDTSLVVTAPLTAPAWEPPSVVSDDRRLAPLLARALADLRLLRLAPVESPEEEFLGPGPRGSSPCSGGTACGRPACCCR
jgi:hypothetical protein